MGRIVKESAVRRNEIIDSAQRLVYTRGYELMTIQDILDDLHLSKGAFYHYFDSKQALLEALIVRIKDAARLVIEPILADPGLPALQKLSRYFETVGRWKSGQKAYLLALVEGWYTDENAVVRQKTQAALVNQFTEMFSTVIQQGIAEGAFQTAYPIQAAELVINLMQYLGEATLRLIFSDQPADQILASMEIILAAYTDAIERILGAPPGSIHLMDAADLKEWIVTPEIMGGDPRNNGGDPRNNGGGP